MDSFKNILEIAVLVRRLTEEVSLKINHSLGIFPYGWCYECSRVLGELFEECGEHGFRLVFGFRGKDGAKSHVWLQRGELIVDITADQFEQEATEAVMVTLNRAWHRVWKNKDIEDLGDLDYSKVEGALYRAIKAHQDWSRRAPEFSN